MTIIIWYVNNNVGKIKRFFLNTLLHLDDDFFLSDK